MPDLANLPLAGRGSFVLGRSQALLRPKSIKVRPCRRTQKGLGLPSCIGTTDNGGHMNNAMVPKKKIARLNRELSKYSEYSAAQNSSARKFEESG